MKKYKIVISFVAASLFTLSGCQDIDLLPKDQIADELFWKTPTDFKMEASNLYTTLGTFPMDSDSDIAYPLQANSVSNGSFIASTSDGTWDNGYAYIRYCNTIIERGETYEGDFAEIERYVAEARFFRAYTHWTMMKKFSDVQIIKTTLGVNSPELYGSRSPQAEVEDFILSELEEIYKKLPLQSELKSDELGRVTQGAALALKARVALYAGTWAKNHKHRTDYQQLLDQAISAANRVVESKEYKLFEDAGDESYRQLFIDKGDEASESILASRYYEDIREHWAAAYIAWGSWGTPTKKLADMYLCKSTGLPISNPAAGFEGYAKIEDEFKNRDPRMYQTFIIPGTMYRNHEDALPVECKPQFSTRPETRTGYKLWKFMGETQGSPGRATYNYHVIRYPEVLLILAEATFEKDGSVSNDILNKTINVIRSRKGVEMPALTNEFAQANGMDMLTEIRRERTIELAFEGFRRDDLRRWKTAETELKDAIKGIRYKDSEYEEIGVLNNGNPGEVDADGFLIVEEAEKRSFVVPKHYYYSMPLDQLTLNPNLLPNNPGW